MDDIAGYIMHMGMMVLFVYTDNKLCFKFQDEFKEMPLRAATFLIMTPQKFQQQSKNCFLD